MTVRRSILFDETYPPIEAKIVSLGTAGAMRLVSLPQITIKETGYLYIYLSYDNQAGGVDVYFDEFKITYTESPVAQVNAYYPYGMTALSWVRSGESENKYLYQGKEYDALTGLHDFHARQWDGTLGRWFAADPMNQFASPYLGMGNNPVMGVDPDGRSWKNILRSVFSPPLAVALFEGGLDPTSKSSRRAAWSDIDPTKEGTYTNNQARIIGGLFETDHNLSVGGQMATGVEVYMGGHYN